MGHRLCHQVKATTTCGSSLLAIIENQGQGHSKGQGRLVGQGQKVLRSL